VVTNVFVATGHGMLGITLGPATGNSLTDYILTGQRPDALSHLRMTPSVARQLVRRTALTHLSPDLQPGSRRRTAYTSCVSGPSQPWADCVHRLGSRALPGWRDARTHHREVGQVPRCGAYGRNSPLSAQAPLSRGLRRRLLRRWRDCSGRISRKGAQKQLAIIL
jgi:hypothetical protein